MKTAAIIQARLSSSRLPGKVLFPLGNTTVLGHLVARLQECRQLDGFIIAIPDEAKDEPLVAECQRLGVEYFRGDENDLLLRFYQAATEYSLETIVRITSDCPFFDPYLLDEMLQEFQTANANGVTIDYYTNCTLGRTFPRGLDAEIFTYATLERAHQDAAGLHEREHVTPHMYLNPDKFRLRSHDSPVDHSRHRWVVDTGRDWRFIYNVHQALAKPGQIISTADILNLLDHHPELMNINTDVNQKNADNTFAELQD